MNKEPKLIDRVKAYFDKNPDAKKVVADVIKEKFETVKLMDGVTELTIEPAVEKGAAIVITNSEGTAIAAAPEEYMLEDGRTVVVVTEGVVDEVKEATSDDEIVDDEPMSDETKQQQEVKRLIETITSEKIFAKTEDLTKLIEDLEESKKTNKFLKEENEALKKDLVEFQTFTKGVLEEMLAAPSKDPVVKRKNPLGVDSKINIFQTQKPVTNN